MDIFGSDDEDDCSNENIERNTDNALASLSQQLFIEAVKFKPFQKKILNREQMVDDSDIRTEILLHRYVAIVSTTKSMIGDSLEQRLRSAKFQNISIYSTDLHAVAQCFDFIAICETDAAKIEEGLRFAERCLVPGGECVLAVGSNIHVDNLCWIMKSSNATLTLQKRSIDCNSSAAIYWSHTKEDVDYERTLLEEITIALSVAERKLAILSDSSHQKAVNALSRYGVVVFKGMFHLPTVQAWGRAATADMNHVIGELNRRGIDFLEPKEGQFINNYHEMSMREAFRCDLRNGKETKKMAIASNSGELTGLLDPVASTSPCFTECTSTGCFISECQQLRSHPSIYEVLSEVMNPSGGEDARGNWGRYNFEEGGPELGPAPLRVGEIGCVMSVPGCSDQTIHADTPHLYVHTQLPGHYYNLFIPAIFAPDQRSTLVGQTAFIAGSHVLNTSARMMVMEGGQELLERNLLRPHLYAGDALIFDCRVLHMGLANQFVDDLSSHSIPIATSESESVRTNPASIDSNEEAVKAATISSKGWRPMLYVNYHQKWFHDPKNWNDAEKLF